ncbi:hypothetical protein ACFYSH_33100 [Streptomyces sp. NPDC005791]|uniref:hypothetical protein n=1 Tax=Streptomyces sp. NPDC005791 TaxID=3364732 RepID=UPI0036B2BBEB
MSPTGETLEMARKFISGEDRSTGFIASMESFVIEHLLDTEVFEFLAEGISLYRPWVGPPYWSEKEMIYLMETFVREFGHAEES